MRVVADTNTVVSAFLWGGPPRAVLDAAHEGRITLHTSPALLAELEDVLARAKFAARVRQVGSTVAEILAEFRALVAVELPATIPPTARDPDDDAVLAAALGARAVLIVTRDRDLLTLGTFRDIPILAAREALELIAAAPR
ncbi:MAG: putative toxin-antitoxin system toxin component, PIN family [Polyangiaceae bacterium]|nr:putative toxin-antitoxin system toxin component, PIN family [Polyangiaceae bacterium]